jgi:hypothetical protein
MVTEELIQQARDILAQVAPGTGVLVVPDSVALGNNPAITLKKQIHVNLYRQQLVSPEVLKYVDSTIKDRWPDWAGAIAIDTILVQEGIVAGQDQALKCAVIWHEQGHVIHGAAESGDVYLFEAQSLNNAALQGQLKPGDVRRVVEGRVPQYKMAVDPGKAALAAFLSTTWNIIL